MLFRDLGDAADDVHACVRVPLMMWEAASLISWTFNLGKSNLLTSGLLGAVNAGNRAAVPNEMRKMDSVEVLNSWSDYCDDAGPKPPSSSESIRTQPTIALGPTSRTLDDWPAFRA